LRFVNNNAFSADKKIKMTLKIMWSVIKKTTTSVIIVIVGFASILSTENNI
jgi:hypothetical protein